MLILGVPLSFECARLGGKMAPRANRRSTPFLRTSQWYRVIGFVPLVLIALKSQAEFQVHLAAPLEGSSYVSPAQIVLAAQVPAGMSNIIRVEFFEGITKIGESTNTPYGYLWDEVAPGPYALSARTIDNAGYTNVSPIVQILVLPPQPSIGINFSAGFNGVGYTLAEWERAGVLPQGYWNNASSPYDGDAQVWSQRDALGRVTPVYASVDFKGTGEEPALNPDQSADHRLMKAFMAEETAGANGSGIITVSQVPFTIYDVIIYSDGHNGTADRVTEYRIGNSSIFMRDAAGQTFSGNFVRAHGTANQGIATPAGNYVRFNGIKTNNFTLQVFARYATDGIPRAGVNAIQIVPSIYPKDTLPQMIRGPYLQSGTETSVVVRWRTNRPLNSRVRFGTNATNLAYEIVKESAESEHSILVTNLVPGTKYFYAVGTTQTNFASGPTCFFVTSPSSAKPTRIWVIGDSGTGNGNAAAVRNAYYNLEPSRHTDLWIMLGDNAYNYGTDSEYKVAVFDMYSEMLRKSVLWSTIGNHDSGQLHSAGPSIPYFKIFDFPVNGEAGGVPSGTERYYSFDFGNIHFVCLDSMTSDRSSNGVMCAWLRADLEANTKDWTIAFWHHPPYTRGSHDSDNPDGLDFELAEMRENVLPILDAYGTDLVLGGHSHSYERSFLLHGHYGQSSSLVPGMVLDHGSGDPSIDEPYLKTSLGSTPYAGAVYIVAGSSGKLSSGPLDHPVMYKSLLELGSLVIDVEGNELKVRFLREDRSVPDTFTLVKRQIATPVWLSIRRLSGNDYLLNWNSQSGRSYVVQHTSSLLAPNWQNISEVFPGSGAVMSWGFQASGPYPGFYRIASGQ